MSAGPGEPVSLSNPPARTGLYWKNPNSLRCSKPTASAIGRSAKSGNSSPLVFAVNMNSCVRALFVPLYAPSCVCMAGVIVPGGPNKFTGVQPAIGLASVPHVGVPVSGSVNPGPRPGPVNTVLRKPLVVCVPAVRP